MIDPRQKRPTSQDLMDKRHGAWLKTLKKHHEFRERKIIQLSNYITGKTAMDLTERELEVLQLVSFGLSSQEIADKMFLSSHTITNHRKNMLSRSMCGNFAELVRIAISENLL